MRFTIAAIALLTAALLVSPLHVHAAAAAHTTRMHSISQVLQLINRDRQSAGLRALQLDPSLSRVALSHSLDMANHDYLSHSTPNGASPYDRMDRAGIHYRVAGENIGFDTGHPGATMFRAIDAAMLQSPEHRANLLRSSFSRLGIGIARVGNRVYLTEDFTG